MNQNIIKYWSKKSLFAVAIFNLISIFLFIGLGIFFIKTIEDKLTNILLVLLVNLIVWFLMYAFSIGSTSYETVYQIKTDQQVYRTKFYRYLLILLGIGWLIFFILNALFMLVESLINQTNLDYFIILADKWWILLIISFYHIFLIGFHRQLIYYAINNQELPWEKFQKNKKKQIQL